MRIDATSVVLALAVLAMGTGAQAQALDCLNPITQREMNACAAADWEAADKELNTAYKATMAALRQVDAELPKELQGGADRLKEAQRAWITYRDKGCEAAGFPMRGGSAEPILVYGCMARITDARTQELSDLTDHLGER